MNLPKGFADLADLPENERIRIIGEYAMAGNIIGVAVDDDPAKVKRYLKKLQKRFPRIRHISTKPGPVNGVVMLSVGPPLDG